jgi:uncharacterized protein YrzB (UPF0473 family)
LIFAGNNNKIKEGNKKRGLHMTREGKGRVTFLDESGEECELEHLATIEYLGKEYAVFVPCNELDKEEQEAIILLITVAEDGDEMYCSVEECIQEAVFDIFKSMFADEYNFN